MTFWLLVVTIVVRNNLLNYLKLLRKARVVRFSRNS